MIALTSATKLVPASLSTTCSRLTARNTCGAKNVGVRNNATLNFKTRIMFAGTRGTDDETERQTIARFRKLVPALGGNYKGAHGKVAVVGGCLEYTGAPFFAAMSALRVGADMAYVICTPSAATAIKSYSPELMVLPYLPEQPPGSEDGPADETAVSRSVSRILPWVSRASVVVVGPGLGADPAVCGTATALMREVRARRLPLVVDGSALTHIVARVPDTVAGYRSCLLTPNVAELGRIAEAVGVRIPGKMSDAWLEHAPRVAQAFGGPVILAKGEVDVLCSPEGCREGQEGHGGVEEGLTPLMRCSEPGSLRRCGGQGDVLAGTAAAFLGWASKGGHNPPPLQNSKAAAAAATEATSDASAPQPSAPAYCTGIDAAGGAGGGNGGLDTLTVALCGYMACQVMRGAAHEAFRVGERSMVAGDIIPLLYPTFKQVVGCS